VGSLKGRKAYHHIRIILSCIKFSFNSIRAVSMHLRITGARHAISIINHGYYHKKTGLKERCIENNITTKDRKICCFRRLRHCISFSIIPSATAASSHGHLRYSTEGGCNGQNSPNFYFGYFIGFSKTYGHTINNIEIWKAGSNTGSFSIIFLIGLVLLMQKILPIF
jgi:hypothetical protein